MRGRVLFQRGRGSVRGRIGLSGRGRGNRPYSLPAHDNYYVDSYFSQGYGPDEYHGEEENPEDEAYGDVHAFRTDEIAKNGQE
jgi:hypothetical protein